MFKFVFKVVLPLVVILVAGLVAYNYYFGTEAEKAKAQELMAKVRGLGTDVVELISSEKEKFDAGKYNDAMKNISDAFADIKQHAQALAEGGQQYLEKLRELEEQKAAIQQKIEQLEAQANQSTNNQETVSATFDGLGNSAEVERLQEQLEQLARDTENLAREMGNLN